MKKIPIKVGHRSGRLVVLREDGLIYGDQPAVICRCDCGKETRVNYCRIRKERVRSCGCLIAELSSVRNRTHGMKGTPTYKAWDSMRARCNNPDHKSYARYGGRGIRVCEQWNKSDGFSEFLADLGVKPDGLTLGRIKNDEGYTPGNCRWETHRQQASNRNSNTILTGFGETKILQEWIDDKRCAVCGRTLSERMDNGWSFEKAFSTPPTPRKSRRSLFKKDPRKPQATFSFVQEDKAS